MPRLIGVFPGRTCHFFFSWDGSIIKLSWSRTKPTKRHVPREYSDQTVQSGQPSQSFGSLVTLIRLCGCAVQAGVHMSFCRHCYAPAQLIKLWSKKSHCSCYAPNFEEVDGHIGFGLCVRPSTCQEPCMLGFRNFIYWFLMDKLLIHIFFLSKFCPFLELCPFEKIRMKSDACHILWTVHAMVFKFYIWIPHGQNSWHTELSPFLELCPFEKIRMKSDACHILWTVHAMVLKFYIWIPHGQNSWHTELSPFLELCPFEKIRMKSDACHILWTVHVRVLKFHIADQ